MMMYKYISDIPICLLSNSLKDRGISSLHQQTELFTSHNEWQEKFRKEVLIEDESTSQMYTELEEELRNLIILRIQIDFYLRYC